MIIPELYVEFCRAVAQLAKDANLERIGVTISPGFDGGWRDQIQMQWWQGRHGEDAYGLAITSTVTVRAELKKPEGA